LIRAGFDAAEFLQVIHETIEAIRLGMDLLKSFIVRGQNTIHQSFHRTLDGGERCAEFMTDIADETPPHGLNLIEPLRHLIEAHRKSREFIRADHLHAFIITTVGDALCGMGHRQHRRDHTSTEQEN
jgi:hypothetical protein